MCQCTSTTLRPVMVSTHEVLVACPVTSRWYLCPPLLPPYTGTGKSLCRALYVDDWSGSGGSMCFAPGVLHDPDGDCTFKSEPRGTAGSSVSVHPSCTSPPVSSLKVTRTCVGGAHRGIGGEAVSGASGVDASVRQAVVGEAAAPWQSSALAQPPPVPVCSTGLPTQIVRRPRLQVGQRRRSCSGVSKYLLEAPADYEPPSASASGYTCPCPLPSGFGFGSGYGTPRRSILLQLLALLLVGSGMRTAAAQAQSLQLTGVVSTLAGQPSVPGRADGVGTNAKFTNPAGVALNTEGTRAVVVRCGMSRGAMLSSPTSCERRK
jgi:hypothetical protein